MRRNDYSFQRSVSDDCDSIGSVGETSLFLHPDHAWGCSTSRRGSSQSEVIELDTYQLGKDFSKSVPGSRRSSFQDPDKKDGDITPSIPVITRRRSSCVRKDPDEILKSLKAVRGELGRTMSLSREQEFNRSTRRGRLHRDSMVGFNESLSKEDSNWRGSGSFQNSNSNLTQPQQQQQPELILGPGQRRPKSYHMTYSKFGDVLLEFKTSRSHVDLRVR